MVQPRSAAGCHAQGADQGVLGEKFVRAGCIAGDLCLERVKVGELFLRSQEFPEDYLDVVAVDIFVEIEKMHLEQALAALIGYGRSHSNVHDAEMCFSIVKRLHGVNPVRWKLFVVSADICGRKPELPSEMVALDDGSEHGEFASEIMRGAFQFARLHFRPDQGAAYPLAVVFP